jgi:hypothetical protein
MYVAKYLIYYLDLVDSTSNTESVGPRPEKGVHVDSLVQVEDSV